MFALVEGFHKPAHVGSFETRVEVHKEIECADRMLHVFRPVLDLNRHLQSPNPDFIDREGPIVWFVLKVFQRLSSRIKKTSFVCCLRHAETISLRVLKSMRIQHFGLDAV